jgi:hypothetical protein
VPSHHHRLSHAQRAFQVEATGPEDMTDAVELKRKMSLRKIEDATQRKEEQLQAVKQRMKEHLEKVEQTGPEDMTETLLQKQRVSHATGSSRLRGACFCLLCASESLLTRRPLSHA